MEKSKAAANTMQKLHLLPNSTSTSSLASRSSAAGFDLSKTKPPPLLSLCLGVVGMHLEDIITELCDIAISFPFEIKMAMAAIARRRKLLNDDVIISLADGSWEILDISDSDVSDVGLTRVVEICKSLRAVDISKNSRVTVDGVSELLQHCHSLEILRCGGCRGSDQTAQKCVDLLKPKLYDVIQDSWEELDISDIAIGASSLRWLVWPNIDSDSLKRLATECPRVIVNPEPSNFGFRGLDVPREALLDTSLDDPFVKDIDPQTWGNFTPSEISYPLESALSELHKAEKFRLAFLERDFRELHIAEKFRLAFLERDVRLAPKRAKNARQNQRRAEKEWMTTSTTAKSIVLASRVGKSIRRQTS